MKAMHPGRFWLRAVSELMIIVIGVLAALAVDSWNSRKADRVLEAVYLDAIAPIIRGEAPIEGDTLSFLLAVSMGGRLGTGPQLGTRTTFDELVGTGAFRLIESASLRASLVSHSSVLTSQTVRIQSRTSGYPMLVHEYFPAELRGDATVDELRAFGFERAVDGFRSDRFERVMNQEFNLLFFLHPILEDALARTDSLMREVDAERTLAMGM